MCYLKRELSCKRELVSLEQASVDVVKGGEGDAVDERANASLNVGARLGVPHRLAENHVERLRTGNTNGGILKKASCSVSQTQARNNGYRARE